MALLFFVFLSVDGRKLREAFHNRRFTFTALAINFIWTPIFAYLLGMGFFRDVIDMQMGLMMLMVMPCTDWYLVFTALANCGLHFALDKVYSDSPESIAGLERGTIYNFINRKG